MVGKLVLLIFRIFFMHKIRFYVFAMVIFLFESQSGYVMWVNSYLLRIDHKEWILNGMTYLNVVCRTWGEVREQGLRDIQVLGHLCEGRIGVGTHLLVPTGRNPFTRSSTFNSHYTFMYNMGLNERLISKRFTLSSIKL